MQPILTVLPGDFLFEKLHIWSNTKVGVMKSNSKLTSTSLGLVTSDLGQIIGAANFISFTLSFSMCI